VTHSDSQSNNSVKSCRRRRESSTRSSRFSFAKPDSVLNCSPLAYFSRFSIIDSTTAALSMANNNFRDVSTTSTSVRPGLLYRSGNVLNGKLPIGCTPRRILDLRSEEEHESDEAWQAAVAPGRAISFRTYSSAAGTFSERGRGQPVNASELFVVHRVSLLDKGAFVRRLVWQLPLLKMLQAIAYKLVGSDAGMREVLIPVVNDLVRGGTRQSTKLAMGVPFTRSLARSLARGSVSSTRPCWKRASGKYANASNCFWTA